MDRVGRAASGTGECREDNESERAGNGEGRNRTGDTTVFSRVLYQLSYLAARDSVAGPEKRTSGPVLPRRERPLGRNLTPHFRQVKRTTIQKVRNMRAFTQGRGS